MLVAKKQGLWSYLLRRKVVSIAVGHVVVMGVMAAVLLSSAFGPHLFGAFAFAPCGNGDKNYSVRWGDTLNAIAGRNQTTAQNLASHNELANPNMIFVNQHICIPAAGMSGSEAKAIRVNVAPMMDMPAAPMAMNMSNAIRGISNIFAYGQCTWWANERFHQMHGVYVPWTTNANAAQWVNRAYENRWRVSSQPVRGAIVVLQPGVQGAQGAGHVAVVEQVLGNGRVVASNMNWGIGFGRVTNVEFHAGPGVSFVSNY